MSPEITVDLNSDLGESFGPWKMGHDEAMMAYVSSANVACGFHAGDPDVMRRTLGLAARHGVVVGAHPGYPDLAGFGRRAMGLGPGETVDAVLYQVGALELLARAEGTKVSYVKPHGALYNLGEKDETVASAIVEAVRLAGLALGRPLPLVAAPGSAMEKAAAAAGVGLVREAFADRAYDAAGRLVSRARAGSLLTDPAAAASRAAKMVTTGVVPTIDGGTVAIRAETICLHGDTEGAPELARAVRAALAEAGVKVRAFA